MCMMIKIVKLYDVMFNLKQIPINESSIYIYLI